MFSTFAARTRPCWQYSHFIHKFTGLPRSQYFIESLIMHIFWKVFAISFHSYIDVLELRSISISFHEVEKPTFWLFVKLSSHGPWSLAHTAVCTLHCGRGGLSIGDHLPVYIEALLFLCFRSTLRVICWLSLNWRCPIIQSSLLSPQQNILGLRIT